MIKMNKSLLSVTKLFWANVRFGKNKLACLDLPKHVHPTLSISGKSESQLPIDIVSTMKD